MLTNSIRDSEVKGGIIKFNIINQFAVFALIKTSLLQSNIRKSFIEQCINEDSITNFKSILNKFDYNLITQTLTPENSYNIL